MAIFFLYFFYFKPSVSKFSRDIYYAFQLHYYETIQHSTKIIKQYILLNILLSLKY